MGGVSKTISNIGNTVSDAWEDTSTAATKAAGDVGDYIGEEATIPNLLTGGLAGLRDDFKDATAKEKTPDTPSVQASKNLGGGLSTGGGKLLEEEDKKKGIVKSKKRGTKGLRIPTTAPKPKTAASQGVTTSAATSGIQL